MRKVVRFLAAFALGFGSLLFAEPASADQGIKVDVYTFSPDFQTPERSVEQLTFCATVFVPNINADWGGGDILGCGSDFVILHYSGTLTFPGEGSVNLLALADDGFSLSLDSVPVIEDWYLKGCSGSWNSFTPVAGHAYVLDAWMYEYGGGACSILYVVDSAGEFNVVPDSWFATPVVPTPEPTPEPSPEPTVEPSPEPTVGPSPEPTVEPEPSPEPTVEPSPEPTPEPTPEPSKTPVVEPEPTPAPIEPESEPEPAPEPPVVEEPTDYSPETLDPDTLTDAQVEELVAIAEETLATAEPGSEQYQTALAQLFVAAQADDPEMPAELAAIPLIGNAAKAVFEAFNALGNIGADIAPAVREEAQKVVVSSVIVGQIAATAALSAVSVRKIN